jgi:hypothetical protein
MFSIEAGALTGGGTITGNLANSGVIAPGISSSFSIQGNLTLDGASVLQILIDGSRGSDPFVTVTQDVTLAGMLRLQLSGDWMNSLDASDTIPLLAMSGSRVGGFLNEVNGRVQTEDGQGSFAITYGAGGVSLGDFAAVPEPSTFALCVLASMMFSAAQLKRHPRRR